jgi:hypothetical protein
MAQLLLPSAKLAVLVEDHERRNRLITRVLFAFGVLAVIVGGLDLVSRITTAEVSDDMLQRAFAPAVLLEE